jgi:transposase
MKPGLTHNALALGSLTSREREEFDDLWSLYQLEQAGGFQEQIYIVKQMSNNLTERLIGKIFNISGSTVHTHWLRFLQKNPDVIINGRPTLFTPLIQQRIYDFIMERYYDQSPARVPDITEYLSKEFAIEIADDTLRHFLKRDNKVKPIIGLPMEAGRVKCDPEAIDQYFKELASYSKGLDAHFLFNVDEMGCQDFVDSQPTIVFVPLEFPENSIPIPVDRNGKRSSLIACVANDGSILKPYIVVTRESIDEELLTLGFTEEKIVIGHNPTGFINEDIFVDWGERVFFPEVERRRTEFSYTGQVILTLDGCSAHGSDYFTDECIARGIFPIFIPPHSSDQVQICDLGIFAITKRKILSIRVSPDLSAQTRQIVRIFCGLQAAANPPNIRGAFDAGGICVKIVDRKLITEIIPSRANSVRHVIVDAGKAVRKRIPINNLGETESRTETEEAMINELVEFGEEIEFDEEEIASIRLQLERWYESNVDPFEEEEDERGDGHSRQTFMEFLNELSDED